MLGSDLFVRERQTVRLTSAGEAYAQELRAALQRISTATLGFRANPQGGTLNVAILPTFGESLRRGGLSANTFTRPIFYQMLSKEGLQNVAPTATTLARIENLQGHLRSIEVRLGK
jgi:DNA-binding transcriptional LysR family regulator